MKKLILILALALSVFQACTYSPAGPVLDANSEKVREYENYYLSEFPKYYTWATSLSGVWSLVWNNIEYDADDDNNYWQSPKETLDQGKGDCEDRATLFLALARTLFEVKGEVVIFSHDNGSHAVAVIGGVYYDGGNAGTYTHDQYFSHFSGEEIVDVFGYAATMYWSYEVKYYEFFKI